MISKVFRTSELLAALNEYDNFSVIKTEFNIKGRIFIKRELAYLGDGDPKTVSCWLRVKVHMVETSPYENNAPKYRLLFRGYDDAVTQGDDEDMRDTLLLLDKMKGLVDHINGRQESRLIGKVMMYENITKNRDIRPNDKVFYKVWPRYTKRDDGLSYFGHDITPIKSVTDIMTDEEGNEMQITKLRPSIRETIAANTIKQSDIHNVITRGSKLTFVADFKFFGITPFYLALSMQGAIALQASDIISSTPEMLESMTFV